MRSDLVYNLNVDPNKIELINNPIDIEELELKSKTSHVNNLLKHNIFTVGRMLPKKGIRHIINALALTKRKDIKLYYR